MPDYNVVFPIEVNDFVDIERTDGYVEVVSTIGHGKMVVTPEQRDLLIPTLVWEDPPEPL